MNYILATIDYSYSLSIAEVVNVVSNYGNTLLDRSFAFDFLIVLCYAISSCVQRRGMPEQEKLFSRNDGG